MSEQKCEHKWVHLARKTLDEYRGYQSRFTQIDQFFCEKCCDQKEVKREGSSRETPEWYIPKA